MRQLYLPRIKPGESICIVGPKGSGKTVLAKTLLLARRNAVIIDTKLDEKWSAIGMKIPEQKLFAVKGGRYHWPASNEFVLDKNVQDAVFRQLLAMGHRVVYIDEAYDLQLSGGLKLVATKGRSRKLGIWISTQRPCHIPLFLFSEAQHFFVFYLRLKRDRARIEEATGMEIPWDRLQKWKYSFLYVREDGQIIGPIQLDKEAVQSVV